MVVTSRFLTAGANDTLTGTAANDVLDWGSLGNDRLIGAAALGVLYGGAGNDYPLSFWCYC